MDGTSPLGTLPDFVWVEPPPPPEETRTQYVYLPPRSPSPETSSFKTVPGAPKRFRYGLKPLHKRVPGPPPSSALPPVFKPVADKYFMDKYAIPTPIPPPTTPATQEPNPSTNNFGNVTPPPSHTKTSHTKIEEAPGSLRIDMAKLHAHTSGRLIKGVERTAMAPGVDLLRKRKTKPRVYEYEPGSVKRYLQGIEDDEKRRATMKAFIHATYPPREDFVPAKDGGYDETLGPNQETGLRQPVVGDEGIPDTETLLLVLAYRAEYNPYDMNVAVRPGASVKAPSSSGGKRSYDEASGYDSDVTEILEAYASSSSSGSYQESDSESERESTPPSSPLEQTTVKRIRIVKDPANIPIPSIEPADPTPTTIVRRKTPIHSFKRDYREYSGGLEENDENDDLIANWYHRSTVAYTSDYSSSPSSYPTPSPLEQTRVKRIRLIKKVHSNPAPTPIKSEDSTPVASPPVTSTGHAAAVPTTLSTGTVMTITDESATSAKSSAPKNATGDTSPAIKHEDTGEVASAPASSTDSTTPALEHKDVRKGASAPVTPARNVSPAPKHEDTHEVISAPATPTGHTTPAVKRNCIRKVESPPATPAGTLTTAPKYEDADKVASAPAGPSGSMTPAPKRKYTRKVASAQASPAVKQQQQQQKRGPKPAPTTPSSAASTKSRQAGTGGGRKKRTGKKQDGLAKAFAPGPDSGSDAKGVEDEKITRRVTRSMKAKQG